MKQRDFTSAKEKEALLKDKEDKFCGECYMKKEEDRCNVLSLTERIRLAKSRKPDPVRIREIDDALKDKSGEKAKRLIVKYEEDKYWRRILREVLR